MLILILNLKKFWLYPDKKIYEINMCTYGNLNACPSQFILWKSYVKFVVVDLDWPLRGTATKMV